MKLQELAVANPTKQAAKVFESYFGTSIKFDTISRRQAQGLLNRVRSLISEHRRTPEFHQSEKNPRTQHASCIQFSYYNKWQVFQKRKIGKYGHSAYFVAKMQSALFYS